MKRGKNNGEKKIKKQRKTAEKGTMGKFWKKYL
jgi:hypothetical protein